MDKKKLYIILFLLFTLIPLGLISEYSAWGEWEPETYQKLLGFIPDGIKNADSFALIPDYGEGSVFMYYFSAILGGGLLYGIFYLLMKSKKNETN